MRKLTAGATLFFCSTIALSIEVGEPSVVRIRDYGAFCDGQAHPLASVYPNLEAAKKVFPSATSLANEIDGVAAQTAVSALRARTFAGSPPTGHLLFPGGFCRFNTTLDLSNLSSFSILIDGAGTLIWGLTEGSVVIDALGMRQVTLRDLAIYGDTVLPPRIGIQIGLSGNGYPADSNSIDSVRMYGSFSLASFYNYSSEVTTFQHVYLSNSFKGTSCYAFVEDGQNHWGISKKWPVDSPNSFNENLVSNSWVSTSNGCTPVWIGGSSRHKWVDSYVGNFSIGGYGAILWTGGLGNRMLDLDVHFETAPTDTFFLTGPNPTPVLIGFRYRDHLNQATRSVFKEDTTTIKSVTLMGGSIEIGGFNHQPHLFADPNIWSGNPDIFLPDASAWNMRQGYSGKLVVGTTPMNFESAVRFVLADKGKYSVPPNTTVVRFVQKIPVSEILVVLPVPLADAQTVELMNYDARIGSIALEPAVHGWTNGDALGADSVLRLRWDASENVWFREALN